MRNALLRLTAVCAIAIPSTGFAIPITYDITFGGTAVDTDGGSGSFIWDAETSTLSNMVWDFGGGLVGAGGLNDKLVNWSSLGIGNATRAQFAAEILTETDVHPTPCTTVNSCGAMFYSSGGLYGGLSSIGFGLALGNQTYILTTASYRVADGVMTSLARPAASVPEPATLSLLGAGLVSLILGRRRRPLSLPH